MPAAQGPGYEQQKYSAWLARKPHISKITIEGNVFISESKIRSHLFSRQHTFWQSLKSGSRDHVLRYSPIRDTLNIKYQYLLEGFLDIQVAEKIEIVEKDSTAAISITIVEGERYLTGLVKLEANNSLPFYGDLVKATNLIGIGEAVNPVKLKEIVFNLKTVYANNGYPYAEIIDKIEVPTGPSRSVITFLASEGALVRFGDLIIPELRYYSPYLARREIVFNKGELYSREKILESHKRLYSTKLFNSISLNIANKGSGSGDSAGEIHTSPNFMFSAIERKPHYLSIKTGASQDSLQDLTWDFSTAWGKRNTFISRRMELSFMFRFIIFTQWRTLYHRYQIKYTEPWFMDYRLPLTVTARFEPGVRSPVQSYRVETWSVSLSTYKERSEKLIIVVSSSFEHVRIYGADSENLYEFRSEQGISMRRKIDVTIIRDTRRDKFMPRQGSYTTYFAQYVGGILSGDDNFYKLEYSWARYQHAFGNSIYATRIKAGWVKEFGRTHEVPLDDRFYLGGANSIRGFSEKSIGPRNEVGTNVGANAYAILNQELRFPLFWKFWGTLFSDLGNGWESFGDVSADNVLFSYGLGIQFISPAGPIRLDYAHRLENGIYKEDDRFHFTILYAF
jgi:outer membrane protein insertion porin family